MVKKIVVLAIRSLDIGGAERQFFELIRGIDKKKFDIHVVTMYGGYYEELVLQIPQIRYKNFDKKGRYDLLSFFLNYRNYLKEVSPDVIYSFLGEMNIFSYFCKSSRTKSIWGFRASNMDLKYYGKVSKIIFKVQKFLSQKVDKIISNSQASIEFHKRNRFYMENSIVIHNGIDTDLFKPSQNIRCKRREELNLKEGDIAILIASRIDYMKGYTVLAEAVSSLFNKKNNFIFYSIGEGDNNIKNECKKILKHSRSQFIWLGKKENLENYYPAFDYYISSSIFGEGFSNSIAEAMSCGLIPIATDVGDSKLIVGENGIIVPSNEVKELKDAIERVTEVSISREDVRDHIVENFSLRKMVSRTEKLIEEMN